MKYLILVALLTTALFSKSYKAFASEHKYETSYEKAVAKAKKEKKDILMVEVTNYCPWCRKLEKKVLSSQKVDSYIHKNYVPLIVNREEGKLPKQFETPIVPVTYIISYKNDAEFKATPGYQSKLDFLHLLKKSQ